MRSLRLGLGLSGPRGAAAAPYTPASEPGILLWVRADKGAADFSGNAGNTVTLVGSPSTVTGLNGQSAWRLQKATPSYLWGQLGTTYTGTSLLFLVAGTFTYSSPNNNIPYNAWSSTATAANSDPGSFVCYQDTSGQGTGLRNGVTLSQWTISDTSARAGILSSRFSGSAEITRLSGTDGSSVAVSGAFSIFKWAINNFWSSSSFSGSGYATLDLCEAVMVGGGTISSNLSTYLSNRYGITP